jgi:pyruvate dehydrogenase E1 component alpha subunit
MLDKPAAPNAANDDIGEETRLKLFETQVVIREAEQRAYDLFLQNLVKGTSHLSLGQEAVAAGFRGGDEEGRPVVLHLSRPRPYARARRAGREGAGRADAARQRADARQGRLDAPDLRGARRDGLLRDHRRASADRLRRGLARAVQGHKDVSVCFFGDGTTNIGAFHEALNFAAVWKLPVVFVCENNLYMEYTPIGDVTAVPSPAGDRASAYGLEKIVIDGNDADAVYRAAIKALRQGAPGGGPSLIECLTYRHSGHSRADPAKYRPEGELERWKSATRSRSTASG